MSLLTCLYSIKIDLLKFFYISIFPYILSTQFLNRFFIDLLWDEEQRVGAKGAIAHSKY